jgi:hypothetical protein
VNYRELHLGRNLLLGHQQFLKRCRSTEETVGKAVQQTIDKVQKNSPTNSQSSPVTLHHLLQPPQNELGLHCSGSGPGTHQRPKF